MEEVYQSKFISIVFDHKTGIFHKVWSNETVEMIDADFVNEMNQQLVLSKKWRPVRVLNDSSAMRFSIPLELQSWLDLEVLPSLIECGLKKIAFLPSCDLITEFSLKQTMKRDMGLKIQWAFFISHDQAVEWLLSADYLDNLPII